MNPIAVVEIVIVSLYLMLPFVPGGEPVQRRLRAGSSSTTRRSSPSARCCILAIWWKVSAKNWFTGPEAHHRRGRRRGVRRLSGARRVDGAPRTGSPVLPGRSEHRRGAAGRADQPQPAGRRRRAGDYVVRGSAERRRPARHRPGRRARQHPVGRRGRRRRAASSTTGPTSGCWSSTSCRARRSTNESFGDAGRDRAGGRRLPPAARRAAVHRRLRHVRPPGRRTSRTVREHGLLGSPTGTTTTPPQWERRTPGARRPRRGRRSRATTTCWPATSSTTASGCG